MSAIKLNELCFAWYPKRIANQSELDIYYCIPVAIGDEYSTCILYYGNSPKYLKLRGRYTDVCTTDLIPISDHTEKMEVAFSVLGDTPDLPISTEVVPAFEDGQYQVRFTIGHQGFSLEPCEKISEDDDPEKEAKWIRKNLEFALNRLKNFKG